MNKFNSNGNEPFMPPEHKDSCNCETCQHIGIEEKLPIVMENEDVALNAEAAATKLFSLLNEGHKVIVAERINTPSGRFVGWKIDHSKEPIVGGEQ